MEALSVEGLTADTNEGFREVKENDLQRLGCELHAAGRLLEMTEPMVEIETRLKNESQLTLIRHLVKLLRTHRMELDAHCTELEKDIQFLADAERREDGRAGLFRYLEDLEGSVKNCLQEFERLKNTGIKSLAPAPHSLPRPGSSAAREMQEMSMIGPGALLKAIDTQTKNLMRLPPEPPDMLNPAHRNALLMKSPYTQAMIKNRQNLSEKPTASMGTTNVTLMLEDDSIPEQFFMAETNRIKAEHEIARQEAERLENQRRYEAMLQNSKAPGQHQDEDLLALENGQSREMLRLAASSDQPQALMNIGNERPRPPALMRSASESSSARLENNVQPIMDQQSLAAENSTYEVRFGEGGVVFELNDDHQCVVTDVSGYSLIAEPGDIVMEANGERLPEALSTLIGSGADIVELKFETTQGTIVRACPAGRLKKHGTELAPLGW
jgi:hypothetical protein